MFNEFDLVVPSSLDEALAAMDNNSEVGTTLAIAGGTNLMLDMRARRTNPDKLISLSNVEELKGIKIENDRIEIGGGTTISDILYSDEMPQLAPSLHASAQVFGGQMVRNTATIAGNICSGSPAADTVPPLLTLDAKLTLASTEGCRQIKLSEFYTGFKQDVRKPNEIISKISWDQLPKNSANYFYKLGLRKGDAITVAGVALALTIEQNACTRVRIAFNSVAPIVKRAVKAEQLLEGKTLSAELIDECAQMTVEESSPIDDVRASAEYRRHIIKVLTRRLLNQAWQQILT